MKKTEANEKPLPPAPGLVLVEDKVERGAYVRMAKARAIAEAAGVEPEKLPPAPAAVCVFGHWWRKA